MSWLNDAEVTTQADKDARQAKQAALAEKISKEDTVKQTQTLKNFMQAGPEGIDTYIDNNVTDMASAKDVLKTLAKIVWSIGWRGFDDD